MGGQTFGIDERSVDKFAGEIADIARTGSEVAVVIGGGNIFRGVAIAAKGADRVAGDHMGMLATVMNALAVEAALVRHGVSAIAMSVAVWEITFNLGVFQTVFFEHGFTIWVASTAAFLASLFVRRPNDAPLLTWRGRFVMLLPSVWLVVLLFDDPTSQGEAADVVFWVTIAVVVIALPYMLYVVVLVVTPDLIDLKERRLVYALAGIVLSIGVVGYGVGARNELFLSCHDFQVSGNDLPARCLPR